MFAHYAWVGDDYFPTYQLAFRPINRQTLMLLIRLYCMPIATYLMVVQLQAYLASQERGINCGQRSTLTHSLFSLAPVVTFSR